MGVSLTTIVYCDSEDRTGAKNCEDFIILKGNGNFNKAALLEQNGWKPTFGKNYCSNHAEGKA